MKIKHHARLLIGLALIGSIVVAPLAKADNNLASLGEKQLETIRQNCVQAQVTLQQIQYSDAAARVNRGQAYETLLTKLMAPFNSRVALNRLDMATDLTADTTDLEKAFNTFKDDYTNYSDDLTETLEVKCQSHPEDFYEALSNTRDDRAQVHSDIGVMDALMAQYDKGVVDLAKSLTNGTASSEVKSP